MTAGEGRTAVFALPRLSPVIPVGEAIPEDGSRSGRADPSPLISLLPPVRFQQTQKPRRRTRRQQGQTKERKNIGGGSPFDEEHLFLTNNYIIPDFSPACFFAGFCFLFDPARKLYIVGYFLQDFVHYLHIVLTIKKIYYTILQKKNGGAIMNTKLKTAKKLFLIWDSGILVCSSLHKRDMYREAVYLSKWILNIVDNVERAKCGEIIESRLAQLLEDSQEQAFLHGFYIHENLTGEYLK